MIRLVVFVVLMLFWLFAGWSAGRPGAGDWAPVASTFIPWACVAILGSVVFGGFKRDPIP